MLPLDSGSQVRVAGVLGRPQYQPSPIACNGPKDYAGGRQGCEGQGDGEGEGKGTADDAGHRRPVPEPRGVAVHGQLGQHGGARVRRWP